MVSNTHLVLGSRVSLVLTLCLALCSCSKGPINDYNDWCAVDIGEIDQRGCDYSSIRLQMINEYNSKLAVFLGMEEEELERAGLGIWAVEDTLYYKNHINRNALFKRMYPGDASTAENPNEISDEEFCFYRGMDYSFAILVLDLPDGVEVVPLPFLSKEE